jgi:hypothetical protein
LVLSCWMGGGAEIQSGRWSCCYQILLTFFFIFSFQRRYLFCLLSRVWALEIWCCWSASELLAASWLPLLGFPPPPRRSPGGGRAEEDRTPDEEWTVPHYTYCTVCTLRLFNGTVALSVTRGCYFQTCACHGTLFIYLGEARQTGTPFLGLRPYMVVPGSLVGSGSTGPPTLGGVRGVCYESR